MARSVTRATIRDNARLYADQRPGGGSTFINDDEYNRLIDLALAELYDRLVAARGQEYYEKEDTSITTANGTANYSLPTDFYQMLAVDLRWGTRLEQVPALEHIADRARFNDAPWDEGCGKAYRMRAPTAPTNPSSPHRIEFFPTPTSAVPVVLRYVPSCPRLTQDSGTGGSFDGVNGWDRAVSLRVAIEARAIEKVSASDLMALYQAELDRIDEMAADRAASTASRIRDVNPEGLPTDVWPFGLPPPA
ncbi:MAG TPA: hypothetical protein VFZ53_14265 [Polyangiaceae bacterium]